jgi:short-subunit dehydrogenase involved in D-alanine esterification of teichoic acids
VIVVGRRKDKLDDFVKNYGSVSSAKVDAAVFDITDLKSIPKFAIDIVERHPDLDCVFLNSGMQRALNWAEPERVDLDAMDLEVLTNYTSYMHLTKAFLPFLQKQAPKETAMIYTTSGLALVPILHCPNYCSTKAALHHMILAMREQLREAKSNVKVVELFPPAVQTELHDFEFGDRGKHMGMPLKDFTEEAFEGLCKEGNDGEQVPVQVVKRNFDTWEQERQKNMHRMIEMMRQQSH